MSDGLDDSPGVCSDAPWGKHKHIKLRDTCLNFVINTSTAFKVLFSKQSSSDINHTNGITGT